MRIGLSGRACEYACTLKFMIHKFRSIVFGLFAERCLNAIFRACTKTVMIDFVPTVPNGIRIVPFLKLEHNSNNFSVFRTGGHFDFVSACRVNNNDIASGELLRRIYSLNLQATYDRVF